ncbi:hypothetical protein [Micromonospora chokoriensis]|uniref:Uncharacterized protein n=1 Tax=Micromonospora chokoriensis TaxID=356851 RepID=A0A1C4YY28_9ACTN|nr:hypothetical protein [Micromonospora chokoriensis]SCF25682.1 hypothetical protein GA0070612_5449 [Micromonospora chokoriensis]
MSIVNLVEKFGADGSLESSWVLPPDAVEPLRAHVDVTPQGWFVDVWPVTSDIAVIVQPWVAEPVEAESGAWFIGSVHTAG